MSVAATLSSMFLMKEFVYMSIRKHQAHQHSEGATQDIQSNSVGSERDDTQTHAKDTGGDNSRNYHAYSNYAWKKALEYDLSSATHQNVTLGIAVL